jgi:predicted small lipoprotein YifL
MKLSIGNLRSPAAFSVPFIVLVVVLMLAITLAGCSQRGGLPVTIENQATNDQLPFSTASDKDGIFPTGSLTPTAIPAGTPVTIHVQLSLSSATSHSGDSFEAVLDQPIIVRGREVAPRGAIVAGKILDARASDQLQEPGYMRLALTAISINGKSFPIQTSSIFVKRGAHGNTNPTVIGVAPMSLASIGPASISPASISPASVGAASIGASSGNRKGTLIGASSRTVAVSGPVYAENRDVGVTPERRLTFRLAQPLPLEF